MNAIVEFHAIQQFAPSNLNRDDTNSPKDAIFGGVRRARISSQSFKRAIRRQFASSGLLTTDELGVRTKRAHGRIAAKLQAAGISEADKLAEDLLSQAGLKVKREAKDGPALSEYLLFLSNVDLDALADVGIGSGGKLDASAKKQVGDILRSCRAVDVALFGRMIADNKDFNVDAACQVAHAISTHRIDREFDFFTAVDDLATGDEAVSGMLGTVEYNSACMYRYAVIYLPLLVDNLDGDMELAAKAVDAFADAFVRAIPTGKQNTFAAHNPPAFVAARLRSDATPYNLANAFERPVRSREGYLASSVSALQEHWNRIDQVYGGGGDTWVIDISGAWQGDKAADLGALRAGLKEGVSGALQARSVA